MSKPELEAWSSIGCPLRSRAAYPSQGTPSPFSGCSKPTPISRTLSCLPPSRGRTIHPDRFALSKCSHPMSYFFKTTEPAGGPGLRPQVESWETRSICLYKGTDPQDLAPLALGLRVLCKQLLQSAYPLAL